MSQKSDVRRQMSDGCGDGGGVLLHPLPGAIRVTRDGESVDKWMTFEQYVHHVCGCLQAMAEMLPRERGP